MSLCPHLRCCSRDLGKFLRLNLLTPVSLALSSCLLSLGVSLPAAQAQTANPCQLSPQVIAQKQSLLQAAIAGNPQAKQQYQTLVAQDARLLQLCRNRNWPQNQAIWLRLYPCDLKPGVLESLLDRIVSRGYNQVYVEVFYSGQVLLPAANNPTLWPPVVRNAEYANRDLLAEAIQKGRERGLKTYAWLFSMNYGYSYSQRPDRRETLARNGRGQTSLNVVDTTSTDVDLAKGDVDKVFVDPYHPLIRQDYTQLVEAILQRQPDGLLFDYIRYPRQTGGASILSRVQDLWIYGDAAQQVLLGRALNQKGRLMIQRFLSQGQVSASDLAEADKLYPNEREPLWEGRNPPPSPANRPLPPVAQRLPLLQLDLWLLSAAHAFQGVVDFLTAAVTPVQRRGLAAGAVFFPDGNRRIGQGFDSRMQPWDQFPKNLEWHPMAYGLCEDSRCIVDQVKRVLAEAPASTRISPAIAGTWGRSLGTRPSLEAQMAAIRQAVPEINSISHFDFSWQDPEFAKARRSCTVNYTASKSPTTQSLDLIK